MATFNIDKDNIPLKAYLRADSYSQQFVIHDQTGADTKLVTDEMFWGKETDRSLYLDYKKIKHRRIRVSEGISQNGRQQIKSESECDEWLDCNIFNARSSKLFVIEGYAGCGKTTLMNNLIQKKNEKTKTFYIDVEKNWAHSQEPYIFFRETVNVFTRCIEDIFKDKRKGRKVWKKFIQLSEDRDIVEFDSGIPSIIPAFKSIYLTSKIRLKEREFANNLAAQLHHKYLNLDKEKKNRHNCGQIETIVSLLILIICAKADVENETDQIFTLIFDNLDVITDPAITAENVLSLWKVIDSFVRYRDSKNMNSYKVPNFVLLITVRKVLYSHITAHLPSLEMPIGYNAYLVNVCDISDLYCSQDILNHRIDYWAGHNSQVGNELEQLKEIDKIHVNSELTRFDENMTSDEEQNVINLDALFNHNYRAFSNVLSIFIDKKEYKNFFCQDFNVQSESQNWKKVATLIFAISMLYRKEKVWNRMGFGCKDFDCIDYPTTLNRLILNYLYMARCGQRLYNYAENQKDIPAESFISLKNIIDTFIKVNMISVQVSLNEEQIEKEYKNTNELKTKSLVVERLADMCARNAKSSNQNAYGYDCDDDEFWRRPVYFVGGVISDHTATLDKELKAYFEKCLNTDRADYVLFSITDEGFVLINDIVASFEFYSARYCDIAWGKPLHQAKTEDELDRIIAHVYQAILLCAKRHNIFMNQYMNKYGISKNKYLKKEFHPRTKPKFEDKNVMKKLKKHTFRPQLHIVRVIYMHIGYFNNIKKDFSGSNIPGSYEMCVCLTNWIGRYLELYKECFFKMLQNAEYNSDNTVYMRLYAKYQEQLRQYEPNGQKKNIDISLNSPT